MKQPRWGFIATGAMTLVLAAACSNSAPDPSGGYAAAPIASAAANPAAQAVTVSSVALGPGTALVDGTGRAVYLFENDTTSSSTCAGTCANVWPPVPASTGTVADGQLGSATRTDGGSQLTYDGHPLYYYVGDHNPGDTTGQGLNQFGAKWYLVQPSGTELDDD